MDIVELIKECEDDEELKELCENAIEAFTNLAKKENPNSTYIGTYLDINPLDYHIDDPDFKVEDSYECVNLWNGYVPLGTKIVYGRQFIKKYGTSCHAGCYYYLDDDSYIFDFFKMVKEANIENEFDIILLAFYFVEKLMGKYFNPKDRSDVNKLIHMNEYLYYRPTKEHSIKDFYYNGSGLCTEKSLIAENLLSIMGLEVMYVDDFEHTYNLFAEHVKEKEEKKVNLYVLDFANWVQCYDVNFNIIGRAPYIQMIEDGDAKLVDQMVNEGKRIELPDYCIYKINGCSYEIRLNKKRNYGTDYCLKREKSLILERK